MKVYIHYGLRLSRASEREKKQQENHDRFGQCGFDCSTIAVAELRCPAAHCMTGKIGSDAVDFWSKNSAVYGHLYAYAIHG